MLIEEDYYYHSSDSDDEDDVDRYVFLARQPAPAGTHAEDDLDVNSANDDDDGDGADDADATVGGEESEGGVAGKKKKKKKRPPPEISDDAPPPPKKARRLELIVTSPEAQTPPSGSESSDSAAASPRGARAGEAWSKGSHEKAHEHRAQREEGEAKKKRGACGKRTSGQSCEVDGDREPPRAVRATAKTGTPGRFLCHLCERCFESHQALGGHVLGHRKKAKIAVAMAGAASPDVEDACGIGKSKEETAAAAVAVAVAVGKEDAMADKKAAVAARRGKANGKGGSDGEKTFEDVAEHGDEDVDRGGHRMVHGGKGNDGIDEPVFAGSQDANANGGFGNKRSPIAVSSHGFASGNSRGDRTMDIGAASPNQKVVVGTETDHEGANGNSNVCRTLYKCKVCDTECLTGRALGGHMRKHRKPPPPPPPILVTEEDCQIPLAQLLTSLQREDEVPGQAE
ncbi:hypothetical protein U9M48_010227 [Paspalum notatum var. saurae]|uniref:C2H2-type domain-containing protein n=1 Tax=Paspalum notatum var. saurae TaxID=547442 RepID=A0AAQ3SUN1_PASNO